MISNVGPLPPAGRHTAASTRPQACTLAFCRYGWNHHVSADPRIAVADTDPIPHFSVRAGHAPADPAAHGAVETDGTSLHSSCGVWVHERGVLPHLLVER